MGCFGGSSKSKKPTDELKKKQQQQTAGSAPNSSSVPSSPPSAPVAAAAATTPNPLAQGPAAADQAPSITTTPNENGAKASPASPQPPSPPASGGAGGKAAMANGDSSVHNNISANSASAVNANEVLRLNLGEVKLVLQKLAGVNGTPMIALNEAAELLCKHLSVTFCSIVGFTDHCTTHILLAAYGNGSSEIENTPVMRGEKWSCAKLLEQPLCLHYSVKDEEQEASLPTDYQTLCRAGNLHSFLTIPIATEHEVLGALTIAKEGADGFEVDWWEPMLGCLSMGLLTSLRNEQTQHLCQLMKILEYAPDYIMLIHHLLRGAFSLLLRATNIKELLDDTQGPTQLTLAQWTETQSSALKDPLSQRNINQHTGMDAASSI